MRLSIEDGDLVMRGLPDESPLWNTIAVLLPGFAGRCYGYLVDTRTYGSPDAEYREAIPTAKLAAIAELVHTQAPTVEFEAEGCRLRLDGRALAVEWRPYGPYPTRVSRIAGVIDALDPDARETVVFAINSGATSVMTLVADHRAVRAAIEQILAAAERRRAYEASPEGRFVAGLTRPFRPESLAGVTLALALPSSYATAEPVLRRVFAALAPDAALVIERREQTHPSARVQRPLPAGRRYNDDWTWWAAALAAKTEDATRGGVDVEAVVSVHYPRLVTITLADAGEHGLPDVDRRVEVNAIAGAIQAFGVAGTIRSQRAWPIRFADFAGPWLPGEQDALLARIRAARAEL